MNRLHKLVEKYLPPRSQSTWQVRWFGLTRIALIYYIRPVVLEVTPERVVIRIPLNRRTRNHQHAMYFGALCIGADLAAGLLAVQRIRQRNAAVSFVFTGFHAAFPSRATGDVCFECAQGREITGLVDRAAEQDERVELPVQVRATVPAAANEVVASFTLVLSLRRARR